jgi:uncharacterized protein (DUF427 family)
VGQVTAETVTEGLVAMLVLAVWNGVVLAESDDTIVVDGHHYFPDAALRREYFSLSSSRRLCPWKGVASYYSITVNGATNPNAAWYYPHPSPLARRIKNRVAFSNGVEVVTHGSSSSPAPPRWLGRHISW